MLSLEWKYLTSILLPFFLINFYFCLFHFLNVIYNCSSNSKMLISLILAIVSCCFQHGTLAADVDKLQQDVDSFKTQIGELQHTVQQMQAQLRKRYFVLLFMSFFFMCYLHKLGSEKFNLCSKIHSDINTSNKEICSNSC